MTKIAISRKWANSDVKPIKYWAAYDGLYEVDRNNSIALLRFKHKGKNYIFKAIR